MSKKALPISPPVIRPLGCQAYEVIWEKMKAFTLARSHKKIDEKGNETADATRDEIWWLEHPPIFTLGQAGKTEHILNPGNIPVIQTDRGGQITYHGPGQLVIYFLCNLKRLQVGIRQFVCALETGVIDYLAELGINGVGSRDAPGVYVNQQKIASIGLRVKQGCTYHGLSFNVNMDLEPFSRINTCGYPDLQVTQLHDLCAAPPLPEVATKLIEHLCRHLGYTHDTL